MAPKLNVIGLVTADMARTLAFYRLLGLDVPASADTEQHVAYALPGGIQLMWDTVELIKSFDPEFTPVHASLAFECATPAEVDKVHDELVAAGHTSHKAPWDAFWGQRYAVVLDPDGNHADLYCAIG